MKDNHSKLPVKNTYGMSVELGPSQLRKIGMDQPVFSGSSLNRKPTIKKQKPKSEKDPDKSKPERRMSKRTKSKIRKKVMAFAQVHNRLTFATFTFLNMVSDEKAVNIFRKFLDNMKKRKPGFEYLWVAERQNKNETFKGNIHFHMISNSYFKWEKTWNYWIDLQRKNGINPRNKDFKPTSAFDIKQVTTKNPKNVGLYLTKYVTKNNASFKCQVWNCSKRVSKLYTDFYTGHEFLDNLYKVRGIEITELKKEYCTLHFVPIDKTILKVYNVLQIQNLKALKQ